MLLLSPPLWMIIERTPGWTAEWMEAVLILMTAVLIVADGTMEKHMDTVYVQVRKDKANIRALGSSVTSFLAFIYG